MRNRFGLLTAVLAFSLIPVGANASTILSASGTGTAGDAISASVEFDLTTYDFGAGSISALQITLTNTATTTNFRGNLVTGVFFNLSGVGSLPTDSSGFDGWAGTTYTTAGWWASNVDLGPAANGTSTDGTYLLVNGGFGIANDGTDFSGFGYGISTVGQGLGFNGSHVDGDNYGIFAPGSDLSLDGLPSVGVMIEGSATFWIAAPTELTSLSQLDDNVRITYGSLPDNYLETGVPIPEPGTGILLGMGLLGLARAGRRK